jgi:hypothetical protein
MYIMDVSTKRLLLFLIGCIGLRSLFAYVAKIANIGLLRVMGWLALIPAVGFMYIHLTGARKTGAEVFGEKIWWNSLRPVHALMYFAFAWLAITGVRGMAWKVLAADVMLGLSAFAANRAGLI